MSPKETAILILILMVFWSHSCQMSNCYFKRYSRDVFLEIEKNPPFRPYLPFPSDTSQQLLIIWHPAMTSQRTNVQARDCVMIIFFYQLDAQILYYNTFITFLYMFRALLCSSIGGQILW